MKAGINSTFICECGYILELHLGMLLGEPKYLACPHPDCIHHNEKFEVPIIELSRLA